MGVIMSKITANKRKERAISYFRTIRYQYHQPIIKAVGVQLEVKCENIPDSYFECGRLDIRKSIVPGTNEFENLVPIKLNSSKCNEQRTWLLDEHDARQNIITIELCVINTNERWETKTRKSERLFIIPHTENIDFDDGISFTITIAEKGPDVQFQAISELCTEEDFFVKKRKQRVFSKLKKSDEKFTIEKMEDVPNIAIMGSGGGLRACIGMSAAMTILEEENILDYATYTAGLSGSAWYLLTLYANDEFNPHTVKDKLVQNLQKFNGTKTGIFFKLLKYVGKGIVFGYGNNASFANIFGELVARLLLEEKCSNKWSVRKNLLQEGNAPLPLIAALHVRDHNTRFDHNEWIEFSPYQVCVPRYGAAINMMNFGKSFDGGYCTGIYCEKPMSFLQGMCGSAYTILRDFRPSGKKGYSSLSYTKKGLWFLFNLFDRLFVAKVPNILRGIPDFEILPPDQGQVDITSLMNPMVLVVQLALPVAEYILDLVDIRSETMMLVDAGIAFNSPYPTVMRPSRNVDLIISFDFSQRDRDKEDPFKDLVEAEVWARKRRLKFPKIKALLKGIEKERGQGQYKEMYIFRGAGTPTILHFVMVNKSFRTIACNICNDFDVFPAYNTMKFDYTRSEYNKLHFLVRHNVKANIKKINECIQTAIIKKRSQRQRHRIIEMN